MKYIALLFVTSLFALAGCKSVPVDQNGALAPEYAAQIDQVVGVYEGDLLLSHSRMGSGVVLDKHFQVEISRKGNRPVLTAKADVLGNGCDSKIGKLKSLEIQGAWNAIAVFAFDPGKCPDEAEGREVVLYLNKKGDALFSLDKETTLYSGSPPVQDRVEYRANLWKI